jgi:hypothetical protein
MTTYSSREFYGWRADESVRQLVARYDSIFSELPFVLVRTVDSTDAVAEMTWYRDRDNAGRSWCVSRQPLIISGSELVSIVDSDDVLFGFDEVWILSSIPIPVPPDDCYLVGPLQLNEDPLPDGVRKWGRTYGVRLGLGDGNGMNYFGLDLGLLVCLNLR